MEFWVFRISCQRILWHIDWIEPRTLICSQPALPPESQPPSQSTGNRLHLSAILSPSLRHQTNKWLRAVADLITANQPFQRQQHHKFFALSCSIYGQYRVLQQMFFLVLLQLWPKHQIRNNFNQVRIFILWSRDLKKKKKKSDIYFVVTDKTDHQSCWWLIFLSIEKSCQ